MAQDPSAPRDDAAVPGVAPAEDPAVAEPGAPIPADAVDPELLRLPPSRSRRSPLLAGAVLLVGALLLLRLRADLAYALQPMVPVALGPARGSAAVPLADVETYVSLGGMPDYRNALAFESRGGRGRSFLFRLLGTGSHLLVVSGAGREAESQDNVFVGRLRRFRDLTYAATVEEHYRQKAQVTRALDLAALRALPDGALPAPLTLPDRAGEKITIEPGRELLLDVLFPDDMRVLLSRDKFPSEPDARHEVDRLGLLAGPGVETKDGFGYVLRLPPPGPARNQAIAKVDAQGMLLWHRVEVYRVSAAALKKGPAGLVLPGAAGLAQPTRYVPSPQDARRLVAAADADETLLPWLDVEAVQISEPLSIPGDALVLLDGESPESLRWTLPVALLLVLFMGFNLFSLILQVRRSISQNQRRDA